MTDLATRRVDLFTTKGRIRQEISIRGPYRNCQWMIERARQAAGVSPEEFRRGEVVPLSDEPGPDELVTDGGETVRDHKLHLAKRWGDRAESNIEHWGNQAPATLFLAMIEEMGEIAQELERTQAPGSPDETPSNGRLLIAAMAALGRRTRRYLEANFEDPAGKTTAEPAIDGTDIIAHVSDPVAIQDELDDLMPLGWQLTWALKEGVQDA